MTERSARRAPRLVVVVFASIVLNAGLETWNLFTSSSPFHTLRAAFAHDQLGYLSIATNVAHGHLGVFEPDTETGVSHYPRAYYTLVGLVARLVGGQPVVAWNLCGMVFQALLIAVLAISLTVFSRRWWFGFLAPAPLLVGTFAWIHSPADTWYTSLSPKSILWGPFGAFYSLNAESAGLCLGASAMMALALVWLRPRSRRMRIAVTIVASASIGVIANMQTYSFLMVVYLAIAILAVGIIVRRRAIVVGIVSVLLLPVLLLTGPRVSEAAGQLPTLVFGLLPFLPGIVLLMIHTRFRLLPFFLVTIAAAAPQLIWTVSGVLQHDPFLTYRVASNVGLGVVFPRTVVSSAVPLAAIVVLLAVGVLRRITILTGIAGGSLVAGLIVSVNDLWGANAEPYRLWIDAMTLCCLMLAIGFAMAVGHIPPRRLRSRHPSARKWQKWTTSLVLAELLVVLLAVVSLPDFVNFTVNDDVNASIDPTTQRAVDIGKLAAHADAIDNALVAGDPCVDPRLMKVDSGAKVAYYHLGMAWPEKYESIATVISDRLGGTLPIGTARRADVDWVITDSACSSDWPKVYSAHLKRVATLHYTPAPADLYFLSSTAPGSVTLWRIVG